MDILKARAKAKSSKKKKPDTPEAGLGNADSQRPPELTSLPPISAPVSTTETEPSHGASAPVTPPPVSIPHPAIELDWPVPPLPEDESSISSVDADEEQQFLHSYAAQAGRQENTRKYLTFDIGNERYGLLLTEVRETIRMPRITEIPRAPKYLLGLVSLRGNMVPIIDLRHRLSLDTSALSHSSRIIVCNHENTPIGFLVDKVAKVVDIADSDIQLPPATLTPEEQDFIEGVGRYRAVPASQVAKPSLDMEASEESFADPLRADIDFFTILRIPPLCRIDFGEPRP